MQWLVVGENVMCGFQAAREVFADCALEMPCSQAASCKHIACCPRAAAGASGRQESWGLKVALHGYRGSGRRVLWPLPVLWQLPRFMAEGQRPRFHIDRIS